MRHQVATPGLPDTLDYQKDGSQHLFSPHIFSYGENVGSKSVCSTLPQAKRIWDPGDRVPLINNTNVTSLFRLFSPPYPPHKSSSFALSRCDTAKRSCHRHRFSGILIWQNRPCVSPLAPPSTESPYPPCGEGNDRIIRVQDTNMRKVHVETV